MWTLVAAALISANPNTPALEAPATPFQGQYVWITYGGAGSPRGTTVIAQPRIQTIGNRSFITGTPPAQVRETESESFGAVWVPVSDVIYMVEFESAEKAKGAVEVYRQRAVEAYEAYQAKPTPGPLPPGGSGSGR